MMLSRSGCFEVKTFGRCRTVAVHNPILRGRRLSHIVECCRRFVFGPVWGVTTFQAKKGQVLVLALKKDFIFF